MIPFPIRTDSNVATRSNTRQAGRQASRLHLVSGDPPDAKRPHIRLAGRMDAMLQRCQPTAWSTNHAALHQSPKAQTGSQPALSRTGTSGDFIAAARRCVGPYTPPMENESTRIPLGVLLPSERLRKQLTVRGNARLSRCTSLAKLQHSCDR